MQGTMQLVVSLKSKSVEFSGETTEVNRYSRTLASDAIAASEVLRDASESEKGGLPDRAFLGKLVEETLNFVGKLGSFNSFTITRGGNKVVIRADDISFVTVKTDGIFRELQDEIE